MNALSVGLVVCDVLIKPITAEVFTADSVRLDSICTMAGGDALNVAVQLSKLGAETRLIGAIGDDPFGGFLINYANERRVDTSGLIIRKGITTSTSIVMIEPDGERHFAYHGQANDTFEPRIVTDEDLQWADIVHLGSIGALKSFEHGELAEFFCRAHQHGAKTSLDITWSMGVDWAQAVLPALWHTDYFMPSLYEVREMIGSDDLGEIRRFLSPYPIKNLVVKLGTDGCYVTDFHEEMVIPIVRGDRVLDTTGAGDSFAAGFLCANALGYGLGECARYGHAVSSYCIQEIGATTAEFTPADILRRLRQ